MGFTQQHWVAFLSLACLWQIQLFESGYVWPSLSPPILTSTILGHYALFKILVAVLAFTLLQAAEGYIHAFTPKHQQLPSKQSCPKAEEPACLASWKVPQGETKRKVLAPEYEQKKITTNPPQLWTSKCAKGVPEGSSSHSVPHRFGIIPPRLYLWSLYSQTLLSAFQKPSG